MSTHFANEIVRPIKTACARSLQLHESRISGAMTGDRRSRTELLELLRTHEAELRAGGVETITLFGSMARDEGTGGSDVDLAVRAGPEFSAGGFDHFGRLDALRDRLSVLLDCAVDLVEEAAVRPRLRQVIAQEGVRAF
jgi:predicted nucleotidyltransferase